MSWWDGDEGSGGEKTFGNALEGFFFDVEEAGFM